MPVEVPLKSIEGKREEQFMEPSRAGALKQRRRRIVVILRCTSIHEPIVKSRVVGRRTMVIRNSYLNGASDKGKNS